MSKLVIFQLQSDLLRSGFMVSLRVYGDRPLPELKIEGGHLPKYPKEIDKSYEDWKDSFQNTRFLRFISAGVRSSVTTPANSMPSPNGLSDRLNEPSGWP